MNTDSARKSILSILEGAELSSVTFVRDYLQLDFDGPFLNIYIWPQIAYDGTVYSLNDPIYRNKLCELIGKSVDAITEGKHLLEFIFDGEVVLRIDLTEEIRSGPEVVFLGDRMGHSWNVW